MANDQRTLSVPGAPFFASLPPVYAGYFRGMAAAVILAALEAANHYLQINLPPATLAVLAPVAVVAIRTAEGAIDHWSTGGGGPVSVPLAPQVATLTASAPGHATITLGSVPSDPPTPPTAASPDSAPNTPAAS